MTDVLRKVGRMTVVMGALVASAFGQKEEQHGRKYQPLPPTAHVVVTVEKGFNGKPLMNAAVIFHAVRDGKTDGNLEVKTDPEGRAIIDLLEVGSHVTLQVISNGFATYATEFDLATDSKELTVKMMRPKAQISTYEDNDGKAAVVKPGVQEHVVTKPGATGSTGVVGSTGAAGSTGMPK